MCALVEGMSDPPPFSLNTSAASGFEVDIAAVGTGYDLWWRVCKVFKDCSLLSMDFKLKPQKDNILRVVQMSSVWCALAAEARDSWKLSY